MVEKTTALSEDRRYGFRKSLEVVKEGVALHEYAATLTQLKSFGNDGWWIGKCPVPEHEDRNPSFYVIPIPEPHVHCYGCGLHGDIFDLFQVVEGGELWEAMIDLAQRYDVELPRRSERWHEWNGEKYRRLTEMRDVFADSYRRRYFKMYRDHLAAIEDPSEREEEARIIWRDLWPLTRMCAEYRIAQKRDAS